MDLPHLRCFVAVAEELHFGRAADRVHLTPSPVSRAVRELEKELGGELFVRGYHRVELTDLGQDLLPYARRVLDETERMKARAQELLPARAPRALQLGVSTLCPPVAAEPIIELIRHALPDGKLEISVAPAAELLPQLEHGELDVALVQLPIGRPRLSKTILARLVTWVVMRTDDPFAQYETLTLDQLAGRTLTLGSPHVEPVAMETMIANLRAHGVVNLVQMPEFDHVKLAARIRHAGGLALTLHPDTGGSARIFDDAAFRLVRLTDEHFKFSLGAAWRTADLTGDDVAGSELVRRTVEALRNRRRLPTATS